MAAIAWLTAIVAAMSHAPAAAGNERWGANYFPNVMLTTHEGKTVRFFDDLIAGKIVAINLIYTSCKYACPLETARLAQVYRLLGDRMGRDVFFYSITIDPEHDTPAVLREYAKNYGAGPGWTFLTGERADIELISKKLGLYTPRALANADGHRPFLLVGNQATGQWIRHSAVDNPQFLARSIGEWMNSWQTAKPQTLTSYADVKRGGAHDVGQYTFATHCSACHTIGRGDNIGPDLLGITARRDRNWLGRFILAPERMNAEGDPIAIALREKYRQVRMPNLKLSASDTAAVIDYIERQSRAVQASAPQPATGPDLTALIAPYVALQRTLSGDRVDGVRTNAQAVASEAAKLGPAGVSIRAAAAQLEKAADLAKARAAFGDLGDAILIYARETNARFGAEVKIAFCPMAQRYWLQKGEKIQNPFHGASMLECGRLAAEIPDLHPQAARR